MNKEKEELQGLETGQHRIQMLEEISLLQEWEEMIVSPNNVKTPIEVMFRPSILNLDITNHPTSYLDQISHQLHQSQADQDIRSYLMNRCN